MSRLQVDAITEDYSLAEREPGFRAVPFNEFFDGVPVPSLSVDRTEAVQYRRLCPVEVRQPQHCFGYASLPVSRLVLYHRRGPPGPQTDDGPDSSAQGTSGASSRRLKDVSACSRQPRRAASMAAMSIFFIVIIASKARFASPPPAASASVSV